MSLAQEPLVAPAPRSVQDDEYHHYRSVGGRRPKSGLVAILTDIWHARELLQQLILRDIRIRYKQAVMGFGWAIFMPVMVVMAGLLVRFSMSQVSGDSVGMGAVAGLSVKALAWAFFVGAIGFATPSLIASQNLVTKVYFPREVIPLASVIAQVFDSAIGAAILAVLLPFLGGRATSALLWVPLLILLLVLFTTGLSLVLSCANLFFRDVKYIVQVMLTFGIFFTPVFTDAEMLGPVGGRLMMLNPLAPLLEGLRLSIAEGVNLAEPLHHVARSGVEFLVWSPWYLGYTAVWAVLLSVAGLAIFRRAATTFAEYV